MSSIKHFAPRWSAKPARGRLEACGVVVATCVAELQDREGLTLRLEALLEEPQQELRIVTVLVLQEELDRCEGEPVTHIEFLTAREHIIDRVGPDADLTTSADRLQSQ